MGVIKIKVSDVIASIIMDMFDDQNHTVQIQRNDLAQRIGCVPSQINYVITSRFTPEQGYFVESRRGGGGCILITRAMLTKGSAIMDLINRIGSDLDEKTCRTSINGLSSRGIIDKQSAEMMNIISADKVYGNLTKTTRDEIRSNLFKQMLLTQVR